MEDFLKEGLEVNDLSELNICILFLKAACLSYISTGDGKSVSLTAWIGINNNARSRYEWPTQPKPNQNIWGKWQAVLHSTYRLRRTLTLSELTQLGPWLHPG